MKVLLTGLGIDVWEVIEAAATKPFGFQPFVPGPGLGGHCIPIDPFYLSWKAKQAGSEARFIDEFALGLAKMMGGPEVYPASAGALGSSRRSGP